MSANISIISLFCKQMREKRSLSHGPSTKKNEENEASPPTPPRRGRGVIYILFELYLQGILLPSLFGEGLGERLLFLLIPWGGAEGEALPYSLFFCLGLGRGFVFVYSLPPS